MTVISQEMGACEKVQHNRTTEQTEPKKSVGWSEGQNSVMQLIEWEAIQLLGGSEVLFQKTYCYHARTVVDSNGKFEKDSGCHARDRGKPPGLCEIRHYPLRGRREKHAQNKLLGNYSWSASRSQEVCKESRLEFKLSCWQLKSQQTHDTNHQCRRNRQGSKPDVAFSWADSVQSAAGQFSFALQNFAIPLKQSIVHPRLCSSAPPGTKFQNSRVFWV